MHAMNDRTAQVEMLIHELEQQMPDLQLRHGDVFALANAWAERYDAIIAVTPPALQAEVEARLSRIGIRWGMMPGARVTSEFRALGKLLPQSRRRMRMPPAPAQDDDEDVPAGPPNALPPSS
jgi:hypothetical protein